MIALDAIFVFLCVLLKRYSQFPWKNDIMNRSFSIDVSSFLHHRIKSATQQECRCIIGGGLRGLVWGIAWLEEGDRVSLIDDRQEIGTPSRRVGWLESTGEGYTWLNSHVNLNSAQHVANSSKYLSGLRVEWLEKLLAIRFLSLGGQILSRAFASHSNEALIIEGTSSEFMSADWTTIHNATGQQPPSPGADGIPFNALSNHRWEGGVVSSQIFQAKVIKPPSLILERADMSLEIWFKQGERPTTNHWLELLETYRSPQMNDLEISAHIERILIQRRESHDL